MKILLISRGTPSSRDPQWGSFEIDQALALSLYGHDVVIISVDRRFRTYYRKHGITKYIYNGIPCYNSYIIPAVLTNIFSRKITEYVTKGQIRKLYNMVLDDYGMPDLIYAHYLPNIELGLYLKNQYGIPVVGIEHWSKIGQKNLPSYIHNQANRTYPYLDTLISVSINLQRLIKQNLGVDSIVVNNMLGDGFNFEDRKRNGRIDFISIGNLLPIKGFDVLIKAFSLVDRKKELWHLNIIGGGKEHDNLQKRIDYYDLHDNITLLGRQPKVNVINYLQKSDVFVVSSHTETFGVAALEALACGLPVISTECGGPRDFITDQLGVFCKVNDPKELAFAIDKMFDHIDDYDRKAISETIHSKFSGKTIAKQLTDIFESVVNKKK